MKTLLIDNYDSFTYNLYQLLGEINGEAPFVIKNDAPEWADISLADFDNAVISPGPGRPDRPADFGESARVILEAKIPVLGVCLGHQGICTLYGGVVDHAPYPVHGHTSLIYHSGKDILSGIPSPFKAVRYHSLAATQIPEELETIARTDDGVVMALRHRSRPLWGVQFHPESICTEHGRKLIENFRELTERHRASAGSKPGKLKRFIPPVSDKKISESREQEYSVAWRKLNVFRDPEQVYKRFFADSPHSFWLDSSAVIGGLSRFSFMGDDSGPYAEFVTYDVGSRNVTVESRSGTREHRQTFFEYLEDESSKRHTETGDLPFDFNLGYVGYLGYELKADCGGQKAYSAPAPDAAMLFADRMVAFDHEEKSIYLLCLVKDGLAAPAEDWITEMSDRIAGLDEAGLPAPACFPEEAVNGDVGIELRHSHELYLELIDHCLDEIFEGESYEVCLTNMISAPAPADPVTLYSHLRRLNPAPYGALLKNPDFSVLSSSPERFLKISPDRVVETKPIKGTRKRGQDREEDEKLRLDLLSSEKDLAENLMIVDLLRNDLNSVCEIGSVQAPVLFAVESYATVHQLVSTVKGALRAGVSPVACVKACFPGGSITGAPKIRTMEIIDNLEAGPRGVYTGALGYFALNGAADLNIVIRTMVVTGKDVSFGSGGAIVAQSKPEDEFEETMIKAGAMIDALLMNEAECRSVTASQAQGDLSG